ncbi:MULTISPECIES: HlyD family secretion protein [unclassified Flavobacterium]|uniref:HlyD family secretion protein n=1 Tax=unclassified Flavobacterium TaxID=196869 RepID=UPI000EAD865D|nr:MULTISPECIES: HlyD family secretion protein [unclassified Flavobacterium]RKS01639.1 membrane fusion protein (multidrug efflux system) [Flavobacterium sp. 102]
MKNKNTYTVTDKLITKITAWIAGIISLILIIWGVITLLDISKNEKTNDAQVQEYINPVIARAGGFITQVKFEENQPIKRGDTILVIDSQEYIIQKEQTEAALLNAKAQLVVWQNKVQTLIKSAKVNLSKIDIAKAELQKEKLEYSRYKKLVSSESATKQKLEEVESDYSTAMAQTESAEDNYQASLLEINEARAQEIVTKAEIKRLKALLDRHKLDVTYTVVTASYDGFMGRRTVEKGQMIDAGQVLAYIVNAETDKWVVANYKETQISSMTLGDSAEFTADAYPDKIFKGVIISFSPATGSSFSLLPPDNSTGNYVKIVQRVPVRIKVTSPKKEANFLKAGMNVNVSIAKKQ